MRKIFTLLSILTACLSLQAKEQIIVVNEGTWGSDNGRLSYFDDGKVVSNKWFQEANGEKLGDSPNDIYQVGEDLIAITVNSSNLVQFINKKGEAAGHTEVANCRCVTTDGTYVYITSFAKEVTLGDGVTQTFDKGFVARIDTEFFDVTGAVGVGAEPEGIAYYGGYLFVANSGAYTDYDSTISVIDVETMEVVRTIDTGQKNLGGDLSVSGQYLCIASPGDYYSVDPATVILDCQAVIEGKEDADCFVVLKIAGTYNTRAADGSFYVLGSTFNYSSYNYDYNFNTIEPETVMETAGKEGVTDGFKGNVVNGIKKMTAPYGIYVNPYTGYIYATDAGNYTSAGKLYQWTPEGTDMATFTVYINPSRMLALDDNGSDSVTGIFDDQMNKDKRIYNLQGIPVSNPIPGEIYIVGGHKIIWR